MAMAEPKEPMQKVHLTAPIAKTVETEDGGREVWGFATLERVDKSGEIADYEGTLKAFQTWSSDIEKRTGGKSKGNLRVMHGPVAAGKLIHWEPQETTITESDGSQKTVKGIWTGAYIPPTKQDIIKDVDEGILSAFSIGGKYGRRWYDETAKAFRYVPELAEYSLVDNPAVPGADIVQVVNKSDGPWNQENRNLEGGESVSEELEKSRKPEGSFEQLRDHLREALRAKTFNGILLDCSIVATYPDKIVVYDYPKGQYFEMAYQTLEGNIVLGDPVKVSLEYVPAEAQKSVEAELEKRSKKKDDKLHEDAEKRAKQYGISFKEGKGHLTPPKGKPTDAVKYGDPVNYAYPIDSDHIKAAVSYFNQDGQREDGGYTTAEWAIIGKRIASAAKSIEGGDYSYKDGKIVTPSDKKGANKSMTKEEIEKAAESAGITVEQMNAFFKAMSGDAPTVVSTVDGDGDGDHNKEFPNPPGPDEQVDIPAVENDVKDAEKESGVAAKDPGPGAPAQGEGASTEKSDGDELNKADQGENLEKAGKRHSKKTEMHLKHAAQHIQAAMNGTDYGPDEHMAIENGKQGDGNTGEEAPPVTTKGAYSEALQKAVSSELGGMLEKFDAMAKGLVSLEKFNESMSAVDEMKKSMTEMQELVKEIHETPQAGGPLLNGGSPDLAQLFTKSANPQGVDDVEDTVLKGLMDRSNDSMVKDAIGQELARRAHRSQFGK